MDNFNLPVILDGKIQDLKEKSHILLPFLQVMPALANLLTGEMEKNVIVTIVNRDLLLLQGQILENRKAFLAQFSCNSIEEYREKHGSFPYMVAAIEDLTALLAEDTDGELEKTLLNILRNGAAAGLHIAAGHSGELPQHIKNLLAEK